MIKQLMSRAKTTLILFALSISFISFATTAYSADRAAKKQKAKYVFYFIGDGMGFNHVSLAEYYLAANAGEKGAKPMSFTQFPVMGMMTTHSASNPITCSSAAGTAMATGTKTNNSVLGKDAQMKDLESIAYKIKKSGFAVGIMSDVTIDHATPGAFYANADKRNMYYTIASQLPLSGFDFFGGGGFEGVKDDQNKANPIYDIINKNGYTVANGLEDFQSKKRKAKKMILFQEGENRDKILPYAIDRNSKDLTLSQVVTSAIEFLEKKGEFFIMAEAGKIDWASHSNDVASTTLEILNLDEAVQVALEFYKKHPEETLIVVTADHETGGLTLGSESGYAYDLGMVAEAIKEGNAQDEHENADVSNYMERSKEDILELSEDANIGWTTFSHTGGAVPVFAIGVGAENFSGRMDNTDLPKRIVKIMGVKF